ncbi:DMT family transporter [Hyphomonas johnsonii]|jgi:drug/metabolite transporter (DMT)-like permease|nr:DMT family transporter [Hyphomonas johnsonii]
MKPAGRSLADWGLFWLLSLVWAGAYMLTRMAVEKGHADAGLPAEWVISGRLTIGAAALWCVLFAVRQHLPPLSDRRRWTAIAGMGLVGSVIPFFLITTAQETVNSSLAALYTAAVPIFVAIGAHFLFQDERLSASSVVGVLIGFGGVALLFGPEALKGLGSATALAQLMLLGATMAYAASSLIARGAPLMRAIPFATAFVSVAAVVSWPLALVVDPGDVNAGWGNWLAVVGLGLGPTAFAQALYMLLIVRTSATFLSLTGYAIPVVAAVLGFVFFGELQSWTSLAAFAMILGGVWLARHGGGGRKAA